MHVADNFVVNYDFLVIITSFSLPFLSFLRKQESRFITVFRRKEVQKYPEKCPEKVPKKIECNSGKNDQYY